MNTFQEILDIIHELEHRIGSGARIQFSSHFGEELQIRVFWEEGGAQWVVDWWWMGADNSSIKDYIVSRFRAEYEKIVNGRQ